jgi:hypothetical protein
VIGLIPSPKILKCNICNGTDPHYEGDTAYCIGCRLGLARARRKKYRDELIAAYGGACTCCGESEVDFLTIEHKDGVPDTHRMPGGKRRSGVSLLARIRDEGYPDCYTIHCYNCNMAKASWGICPHMREEEDPNYPVT